LKRPEEIFVSTRFGMTPVEIYKTAGTALEIKVYNLIKIIWQKE